MRIVYWVVFVDGSTSVESRRSGVVNLSSIVRAEEALGGQASSCHPYLGISYRYLNGCLSLLTCLHN